MIKIWGSYYISVGAFAFVAESTRRFPTEVLFRLHCCSALQLSLVAVWISNDREAWRGQESAFGEWRSASWGQPEGLLATLSALLTRYNEGTEGPSFEGWDSRGRCQGLELYDSM